METALDALVIFNMILATAIGILNLIYFLVVKRTFRIMKIWMVANMIVIIAVYGLILAQDVYPLWAVRISMTMLLVTILGDALHAFSRIFISFKVERDEKAPFGFTLSGNGEPEWWSEKIS